MRRILVVALVLLACLSHSQNRPPVRQVERPVTRAEIRALLAKQAAEQRAPKADEDLTRFLGWAALFVALASAVASAIQARAAFVANRKTDRNLELTKQAADAATESARLTKRALEDSEKSGAENLALTRQAASAATKSAEVAEQSLGLYERPWVIFQAPVVQHRNLLSSQEAGVSIGSTVASVVYPRIVNSGRSPAMMISVGAQIITGTLLPEAGKTIDGLLAGSEPGILTPGTDYNLPPLRLEYTTGQPEGVFVVTAAEYADLLGKRHRSVSIWGLEFSTATFFPIKAEGYYECT